MLSRGDDIVPIPGTARRDHLEENVAALAIRLDQRDLARIDEVAPHGVTSGARYPELAMRNVNG